MIKFNLKTSLFPELMPENNQFWVTGFDKHIYAPCQGPKNMICFGSSPCFVTVESLGGGSYIVLSGIN